MKFLFLLLALNTLALSCLPCTDKDCETAPLEEMNCPSIGEKQHEHEEQQENCSSGCVCSCYRLYVQNRNAPELKCRDTTPTTYLSSQEEIFLSFYHHLIWQPPQEMS